MTTAELNPLLQRVMELGGPINVSAIYETGAEIVIAPPVNVIHYTGDHENEWFFACIIHALALDALSRGWFIILDSAPDRTTTTIHPPDGTFRRSSFANAPTLLEATLRAWIAAREAEE